MLTLSRYAGEEILIGDNIIVRIASVDRGKVRIAIAAPKDIVVMRDELVERQRSRDVHEAAGVNHAKAE